MKSIITGLGRKIHHDMILSDYLVPAGTLVFRYLAVSNRDPSVYQEPDRFWPERWLKSDPHYQDIHPFAHLPFGHGPRYGHTVDTFNYLL